MPNSSAAPAARAPAPTLDAARDALAVRGISKTYAGGVEALKGIDITVRDGDFFALLGPNGAGKSTLIGIISSLVNKTAGQVQVYGHDLDKQPRHVRALLGIVPQEVNFNMFESPWQIVTNQAGMFGLRPRHAAERAEICLRRMDLWDKRDARARALSGGMKRRLMIARALVHQPQLLILDEPTAGVDIELRRSMWQFLTELNESGTTIILTTHYLEEAESLCRHIAIIDHGAVVEDAAMGALLDKLHVETFVLETDAAPSALPGLANFAPRLRDARTIEVDITKPQTVSDLFVALDAAGIGVVSLRNKANRLEELFVRLVEKPVAGNSEKDAA